MNCVASFIFVNSQNCCFSFFCVNGLKVKLLLLLLLLELVTVACDRGVPSEGTASGIKSEPLLVLYDDGQADRGS